MASLFVRVINSSLYGRSDFMNFDLNYEGFEEYFVGKQPKNGGIQYKFKFPNGYGASVIKSPYSYGGILDLWELAVILWNKDGEEYELVYDTKITFDVEGCLEECEVRDLLKQIQEL